MPNERKINAGPLKYYLSMKGINLVVFILFFLCACSQNNKVEESTLDAAEIPIDAIGVLMNSDTLKPPVLVPALPGVRVNAGLPDEHFFAENYGETGGISYMQNYTTDQGLSLDAINFGHKSAICDKAGNLWFATEGGGVSRYDGKSFANFTYASGLASNNVRCVAEDRHGNIWFGTYLGGLSRYDGKSFSNFTTVHGLASDVITSITEDKKGNLWVGTQGGGVSRYDGKSFVNFTTAQGLANDIVLSIVQDNTGNLWFGTYGGGVSRYDGKSFTTFTKKHGLANNFVGSIIADKFGNLWFGSNGKGVTRFDGKEFKVFTTAQGLSYNNILSISEDKKVTFGLALMEEGCQDSMRRRLLSIAPIHLRLTIPLPILPPHMAFPAMMQLPSAKMKQATFGLEPMVVGFHVMMEKLLSPITQEMVYPTIR